MSKGKDGREYDGFASFPADGLTDHLPECECAGLSESAAWQTDCICDRLRAAEQRVRESEACLSVCADRNYRRGLDAAREAVAALPQRNSAYPERLVPRDDALAAIDALILNDAVETLGAVFK